MNFKKWAVGASILIFSNLVLAGDPKAAPDVVGRDLAVSGLGWFGHVGYWDSTKVIEAMNETNNVIQANTLENFKARSPFWGAKYGRGGPQALQVVSAGWAQRNFSPTYTHTSQSTEGGQVQTGCRQYSKGQCVSPIYSIRAAQFRCDTFVNYAFLKGTGQPLVLRWAPILPNILYNAMPLAR